MFKKTLLLCLVLLCTLTTQASPKNEITMLVVPRDAKTIQIAQDISQHYPILLVSYQQTDELLKLYAWNGTGWVDISVEDYVNGAFFENPPQHAILIEPENKPASGQLIPDGLWCENGNRLTSTDSRVVIHLLGRYLDFPNRRWKQFARSHGYRVGEINPSLMNIAWWQYPPERPTPDFEADMDHWLYLDITPPEPIEPVVVEEEPEPVEPAEIPADVSSEALAKEEEIAVEEVIQEIIEAEPVPVVEESKTVPEIAPEAIEVPATERIEVVEEAKPEVKEVVLPEESVEDILNALKPAAGTVIDPFSTDDIPAAKIILPAK